MLNFRKESVYTIFNQSEEALTNGDIASAIKGFNAIFNFDSKGTILLEEIGTKFNNLIFYIYYGCNKLLF